MRRILALASLFLAGCATHAPVAERLDRVAGDLHRSGLFQGALVIGRDAVPYHARGYGFADVERRVPFTPATPTDGASLAKTFTASALAMLADEGKVDFDAPVQRYVPAFPHAATRVRHLLRHSAGLPDYGWMAKRAAPGEVPTNASNVACLARAGIPPAFTPGTRFEYDNVAYDVAALVIESASGMPYAAFLESRFFKPLGLAAFVRPARFADWPGTRTRGYSRTALGFADDDAEDNEGFHGAANVYLSALDLFRWTAGFDGIVGASVAAESRRPATLDDGRMTGLSRLNWYVSRDGAKRYYLGHHNGFHAVGYSDRASGVTIAYVANDSPPAWLQPALARALIAIAEGREPERLEPPSPVGTIDPVTGDYGIDGIGDVGMRRDGKQWRARIGAVEYAAFPVGARTLYVPGQDAYLRFRTGQAGDATLEWDSIFLRARGARR